MTIENIKDRGLLLFESISGSRAYGTNLPTSDTDIKGVYIQPLEEILGFGYKDQINDAKCDKTYYEIRRFLELISTANPNLLELLNSPEDCILYKHPLFDEILNNREKFLTKECRNSFAGYAVSQIQKARGLNKKIVNPVDKERKSPLDFAYIIDGYGTKSLAKYLEENGMEQKFCGLSAIPNARDMYAMFYDESSYNCFSESRRKDLRDQLIKAKTDAGITIGLGYKGILLQDEESGEFSSNTLRLSSIPIDERVVAIISYNKDGYTKYCKDYKEYWSWVENRNEERYNNNISHGKGFDSKNLSHCHRLLNMATEILEGRGILVRRPDREYLLSIRKGELNYDELLATAEEKIKTIDELFKNSNLPDKVDREFTNDLLIKIRKQFYKL